MDATKETPVWQIKIQGNLSLGTAVKDSISHLSFASQAMQ